MTHSRFTITLIAGAVLGLASSAACALDWGGYFRAGPAATRSDAARACYGLAGPGLKYRLGNECDIYGEFAMSQAFKTEGVDYKAVLMTNLWNPQTDTGDAKIGINQMYVEGKGFDVAPNATFWMGKRFYARADVHIVDTFFTNLSGVGAGVTGIDVGAGKLAFSYFKNDQDSVKSGNRFNAELFDVATNPGGSLHFVGTATDGNFTGGTKGLGLSVQHSQDGFLGLGGNNSLWLQYAQGSAGLDGNFGDLSAPSAAKSMRIVESFTWQQGVFGGQALAMWQQDKNAAGLKTTSISLGGRASYGVTKNFKLVSELGISQKKPEGGETARLTKFTFAPTLSTGPGFWNRPELRLYVTTAKWNDAAGNVTGQTAFDGKTSGTSYGAQVEIWF